MSKSFWLMSAGIAALGATPAYAQDQTAPTGQTTQAEQSAEVNPDADVSPTDDVDTGDIIVTAQGRAQILQDVPLAVSAVSAESLQNSGASDIRQLNQLAPSLLVSSTGTEANGSARIRGIGTVGDNPGLESSVAVFIDGVYRSRSGIGLNELGEIERVEVLRGPQGTLFGRNASAGILNIVSKKPSFNFEGYGSLTYGNYDMIRGDAGVTGPLSDTIAFRLDGVYTRRDGFYKVVNAAGGTESRVNNRNRLFTRGQLLFEPNDALQVRLIGDFTTRTESCCGATYISTLETFDPTPGVPGDYSVRPTNRIVDVLTSLGGLFPGASDPFNRQIAVTPGRTYEGTTRDWGVSGQVDYDFGGASLTSITAYRNYKAEGPSDTDYTNVDILFREDDGNAFRQFKTFSQELRLQGSAFSDHLDWLIGGYFANEKLHVRDNLKFGSQYGAFAACRLVATINPAAALRDPAAPGCLSPAGTATLTGAFGGAAPVMIGGLQRLSTVKNVGDDDSNYFQDSTNWAIFTHNIFKITDKLAFTLGLRYTSENKDFHASFNNTNTICPTQQAFFSNFLPGGSSPFPASLQGLAQGIVNLTCQGNATSGLNALTLQDERSEDEWTGTGILSYKPVKDLMMYASYSKGYKAGGFNLDRSALGCPFYAPTDPRQTTVCGTGFGSGNLQFDAEKVDAYELGVKFGHRGLTFNVAIFRQLFKDFQLNTFNGSVFLVQNINGCGADLGTTDQDISPNVVPYAGTSAFLTGACPADDVKAGVISQGVELEATFSPHRDIQVTAGFTFADTHYRKDLVGRNTGAPLDPALFLLPGDNLSNAPELVSTFSFAWTPRIGGGGMSGLFYIDGRMSDDYNTGSDLFPEKEQEAFALFNARVGIRGPEQRWSVELWAQNLFNQDYQQVAFNTPFQGTNSRAHIMSANGGGSPNFATANQLFSSFLAEPRTFGITGRFRF
ncbi:MAG TPA: TonB-dependent receptor [Allosphingosinicella sp.]|nr:TonB-dependent receptor [Allosphingosinicella sp.]